MQKSKNAKKVNFLKKNEKILKIFQKKIKNVKNAKMRKNEIFLKKNLPCVHDFLFSKKAKQVFCFFCTNFLRQGYIFCTHLENRFLRGSQK
jgi:hypothetical protein